MASARFTNNDKLMGLGERPGPDVTARLLLALTALYVERLNHTHEEQRQYTELAVRLIDRVDEMTRTAVANILAGHAAAPSEVRERLTRYGNDPTLAQESAGASSDPPALDRTAPDRPVNRWLEAAPEPAVAATQPAVPTAALGEGFFAATAAQRRELLASMGSDPIGGAAGVATDLDFSGLDAAALEGRIGAFVREFERLLAIPSSLSERIVNDLGGEPFVVAAKSVGMPIAVLQRILLLVNPAVSHSVQRVYDLTDLYHTLDRGAAVRLMSLWRAEAKPDDPAAAVETAGRPSQGAFDASPLGLRSRFGALSDRLHRGGVKPRLDPGSIARRDLRSR